MLNRKDFGISKMSFTSKTCSSISSMFSKRNRILIAAALLIMSAGCRQQMADQPRFNPLQQSTFFGDELSARPLVPGTIPRGFLKEDHHLYEGKVGNLYAIDFPTPVTKEVVERGRERFNIYCAMCHGYSGYGNGMIVQRGFSAPPSFHSEETRKKPVGYYFSVMTNGFGAMGSYAAQVQVKDRWAIIAYIRTLQFSQNAKLEDVPASEREKLQAGGHQ